jgi:hypothetical protein
MVCAQKGDPPLAATKGGLRNIGAEEAAKNYEPKHGNSDSPQVYR